MAESARWVCFDCHGEKTVVVPSADYDAAQTRIRVLEAQLAACKIARDGFTAASDTAHARVIQLEADLLKYGAHTKTACVFGPIGQCVCGLKDALARCSPSDRGDKP